MLISQLNAEVEAGHAQLEQERIEAREMQNQLALANEELERMAMQLDETGQQLDNVHNEVCWHVSTHLYMYVSLSVSVCGTHRQTHVYQNCFMLQFYVDNVLT